METFFIVNNARINKNPLLISSIGYKNKDYKKADTEIFEKFNESKSQYFQIQAMITLEVFIYKNSSYRPTCNRPITSIRLHDFCVYAIFFYFF